MMKHDSQRGWFAYELHKKMKENPNIYLIVGDLGYRVFDQHREDFPDRVINPGAAEVTMMGVGVGLAMSGKIPFVYSITPFLIYRPFEMIRNYINHEKIPVKLVGSGRDKDYAHDGFSHNATDIMPALNLFPEIKKLFPQKKEVMPGLVDQMIKDNSPYFISLSR